MARYLNPTLASRLPYNGANGIVRLARREADRSDDVLSRKRDTVLHEQAHLAACFGDPFLPCTVERSLGSVFEFELTGAGHNAPSTRWAMLPRSM